MAANGLGTRTYPASIKVVGVGLGRTGTASPQVALEMLHFGPCYHLFAEMKKGHNDFDLWSQVGDETCDAAPETLDKILRGWGSVLDYPAAINAEKLYAAYPDAKFILTTRNPEKWEKSMKDTVFRAQEITLRNLNALNRIQDDLRKWHWKYILDIYHRGRLMTHTQQEFLNHTKYIKKIIPPEKLLVYEVGEGWDRLAAFLRVPKPAEPFPHVNEIAEFRKGLTILNPETEGRISFE